jgi:hypothetical protein
MEATAEQLRARIAELEETNRELVARVALLEAEREVLQSTVWEVARSSRPPAV